MAGLRQGERERERYLLGFQCIMAGRIVGPVMDDSVRSILDDAQMEFLRQYLPTYLCTVHTYLTSSCLCTVHKYLGTYAMRKCATIQFEDLFILYYSILQDSRVMGRFPNSHGSRVEKTLVTGEGIMRWSKLEKHRTSAKDQADGKIVSAQTTGRWPALPATHLSQA